MNGSPHGGPQGGPPGTPENWRGKMDQWRQQALAERRDHEPQARRQVQSQFQQYSPPWYSSMVGFNRDFNLLVAQSRLSGFAATLGRDFSDEEAKAITEYTLAEIHSNAAGKFGIVGLAGYMTYRGRHTWQFPFYRPKLGGRFNPNEATSLFSNKKIRGVYPNLVWHTMRFLAYTLVTTLMVEPVYRTVNHIRTESQMTKDPRLQRFAKDASARVEQILTKGPGQAPVTRREDSEEDSQNDYSFDRQQIEQQPSPDSDNHSPSQGNWYNPTQTMRSRQPTQEQQPQANDDWDVLDDDDASPVASTSRNSPSANVSGGSAWDRLRQQSQPRNRPNFESQSNWENASRSQPQQSQGGWGEPPRSRDSYSYSSSDQDKGSSKDQAQAEFDRLVERERRGVDQENAWSRR